MKRNVMMAYPTEDNDVLVTQSEESARIEARRYWEYIKARRPDLPPKTDDEKLEDWMIVNWAWFDYV